MTTTGLKTLRFCVCVTFLMFALACSKAPQLPMKSGITVTDFRGVKVTLPKRATRVVCLIESALSGIYMLDAEDTVVGVPTTVYNGNVAAQYAALDVRIKQKQILAPGNWDFVNMETVLALEPDLVIIWASQIEAISGLEKQGIRVYGVMLKSLEDVYKEITDLGVLLDKKERAKTLVDYTRQEMNVFSTHLRTLVSAQRKKVYFMWAQSILNTAGKNSTVDQVIEGALGFNVCRSELEHLVINKENLLIWNPEIIIMWQNERLDAVDILKEPGLQTIDAVQNNRVYELPSVFYGDLWTLKFQYVIKMMAKWFWPAELKTLDLEHEKTKMLDMLYGAKDKKLAQPKNP